MILTKEIKIVPTSKNISYYRNKGYDINIGDEITIPIGHLPERSKKKINVKCKNCGIEKQISYSSYTRNIKNGGYYGCSKCSNEKAKTTCLDIYGVKHATQSKIIMDKTKKTNQERWGVDWVVQNEDVKQKIEDTNIERYGVKSYLQTKDSRDKMLEYFDEHMDEVQKKREETNIERYGFSTPLQSEIIKDKIKETKIERYNDEFFNNRELYKETCLNVFGFDNPMKNIEIQQKLKTTLVERYGVEYPAQYPEFFEKMLKNGYKINQYKNTELYYQGTYEKDFLDRYYDIGIKRGESIKYFYKDVEHIYFPDFYYEPLNLIIEIKSSKWYEEHKEKNEIKKNSCIEQGYNFIFITDMNYEIFENIIGYIKYNKKHCWQYDIRLNTLEEDLKNTGIEKDLHIKDFEFEYIDSTNKKTCSDIIEFIKKYEWLGKMPTRPTHRFIAKYNGIIGGVIVISTPNQFSKMLGDDTHNIEKLISRGASASWTPKNLASSLLMWSINWMVKNTQFRLFTAYSDTEAKELGTIYQACNFYYIGRKYGSNKLYFDINNPHLGWVSNRTFRKRGSYKKYAKVLNIKWGDNWMSNTKMLWNNVPNDIELTLKNYSKEYIRNCMVRKTPLKHKYVYILGENKRETNKLRKEFLIRNKIYNYPKER